MKKIERIMYVTFTDPLSGLGVHQKETDFCGIMGRISEERGISFKGIDVLEEKKSRMVPPNSFTSAYFTLVKAQSLLYTFFSRTRFLKFIFWSRMVAKRACKEIEQFNPDVILYRYHYIAADLNPKKKNYKGLFITEHHADISRELSFYRSGRYLCKDEKARFKRISADFDAVIGVTAEIARSVASKINRPLRTFVMANGIDCRKFPVKKVTPFTGETLKMIFIAGNIRRWHGIDRMLRGMKNYQGKKSIELHVVGTVDSVTEELVDSLDLKKKVHFHGPLLGEDLTRIFDDVHVALGSLALHRAGLHAGATLKVREYMARGIPFVISHADEDIDRDCPFMLKIPSGDGPVDIEEVLTFTKKVYDEFNNEISSTMRKYALENMDYSVKVNSLLDFISDLAASTN